MSLVLEIITPEGVAWRGENLAMVTLPASGGEVGIMPGHIPLITMLNEGAVIAQDQDGKIESIAVDKGYARCMGDAVSVLTEAAIDVSKLTEKDIEQAKQMAIDAAEKARSQTSIDPDELDRLDAIVRFTVAQEMAKSRR